MLQLPETGPLVGLLSVGWSTLLTVALQGSLVLLVAHLLIAGLGFRMSAAWRHRVWSFALCSLFALPLLSHLDFDWRGSSSGGLSALHPKTLSLASSDSRLADESVRVSFEDGQDSRSLDPIVAFGLLAIWVLGVFVALVDIAREYLRLRRLTRSAQELSQGRAARMVQDLRLRLKIRRGVCLRTIRGSMSPMTLGGLRPCIVLPGSAESWSDEWLEMALLHELVHIKRLDVPVHGLLRLSCALAWFNPLAWRAATAALLEREKACDDQVLLLGVNPADYAEGLVTLARDQLLLQRSPAMAPAMALAQPTELRQRLLSILNPSLRRRSGGRWATALGAGGFLVVLMTCTTLGPRAATPHPFQASALMPKDVEIQRSYMHYAETLDRAFAQVEDQSEIALDVAFMMLRVKEFFVTGRAQRLERRFFNAERAQIRIDLLNKLYLNELKPRLEAYIPELLVRGLDNNHHYTQAAKLLEMGHETQLFTFLLQLDIAIQPSYYRPANFFSPSPSLGMETPSLGGVAALAVILSDESAVPALMDQYERDSGHGADNAEWALRQTLAPDHRVEVLNLILEGVNDGNPRRARKARELWRGVRGRWKVERNISNKLDASL